MQARMTTNLAPGIQRYSRWLLPLLVGVGYFSSVFSAEHLSLVRLLLLTVTYSAWLGIFLLGSGTGEQPPLWWFWALFILACASQFLPLPITNLNWLPVLPTITACLMTALTPRYLGLIAAGVLWLSSSVAFSFAMGGWDLNTDLTLLVTYISFVVVTVAIREVALAHTALARSNAELAAAHTQLQEYSAQVEEISAIRERNRIAREIHDTLGHSLTLLAVQLETATQFEARGDPGLHEELLEARRVARTCLADVRHSVEALRPDDASISSLQERLEALVAEFAAASRETTISLDVEEATQPLNSDVSMALYRCAQEALTNIRKHAQATKVLLRLSTSDEPESQVELTVLDNGQGSASGSEERTPGFGLLGMRERAAPLGGTVQAGPEPGRGWRVTVLMPLNQRQSEGASAGVAYKTGEKA